MPIYSLTNMAGPVLQADRQVPVPPPMAWRMPTVLAERRVLPQPMAKPPGSVVPSRPYDLPSPLPR